MRQNDSSASPRVSNKARKRPRVSLPNALPSKGSALPPPGQLPCQPPILPYHLLAFKWRRFWEKAPHSSTLLLTQDLNISAAGGGGRGREEEKKHHQ